MAAGQHFDVECPTGRCMSLGTVGRQPATVTATETLSHFLWFQVRRHGHAAPGLPGHVALDSEHMPKRTSHSHSHGNGNGNYNLHVPVRGSFGPEIQLSMLRCIWPLPETVSSYGNNKLTAQNHFSLNTTICILCILICESFLGVSLSSSLFVWLKIFIVWKIMHITYARPIGAAVQGQEHKVSVRNGQLRYSFHMDTYIQRPEQIVSEQRSPVPRQR